MEIQQINVIFLSQSFLLWVAIVITWNQMPKNLAVPLKRDIFIHLFLWTCLPICQHVAGWLESSGPIYGLFDPSGLCPPILRPQKKVP
jgi:hypothetical protein